MVLQETHSKSMQGTPVSIFRRAWVMFSIWLSKNTGSTVPSHSSSSIRYGILPFGQRAVLSFTKEFRSNSDPSGLCRAMSPSMRWEVSQSGGTGAKAPRRGGRGPLHDALKNPRHKRQPIIILAGSDQHLGLLRCSC